MARPLVGIICNSHMINDEYPAQAVARSNIEAVAQVAECAVALVPADPLVSPVPELLARYDGFVLPGGRPNVHPSEYGQAETPAHGAFDRDRDAVVLPLVRACVARGQPIMGLCRGFQEVAVAFGATLHPEIRDLPGRDNHRMPPDGTLEEKFALRHEVRCAPGGVFARLFGAERVMTNTLHGQGIDTPGDRVVVDGRAPDGTAEAIYIKDAPGFTLSVQWHPEWNAAQDPVSRALYRAFGEAARAWVGQESSP